MLSESWSPPLFCGMLPELLVAELAGVVAAELELAGVVAAELELAGAGLAVELESSMSLRLHTPRRRARARPPPR